MYASNLQIAYLGSSEQTVSRAVLGTAVPPAVVTVNEEPELDFGSVAVGGTVMRKLTLTNTGAITAFFMPATGLASPFSFVGGGFPGGRTTCRTHLSANASCEVAISFDPDRSGVFSDTVEFIYNDGAQEQKVSRDVFGRAR